MTTEENNAEFLADFRAKVERGTIERVTDSMKNCKICCDAEAFSEHDYSLSFCEEHQEWELVDESLLETDEDDHFIYDGDPPTRWREYIELPIEAMIKYIEILTAPGS